MWKIVVYLGVRGLVQIVCGKIMTFGGGASPLTLFTEALEATFLIIIN